MERGSVAKPRFFLFIICHHGLVLAGPWPSPILVCHSSFLVLVPRFSFTVPGHPSQLVSPAADWRGTCGGFSFSRWEMYILLTWLKSWALGSQQQLWCNSPACRKIIWKYFLTSIPWSLIYVRMWILYTTTIYLVLLFGTGIISFNF